MNPILNLQETVFILEDAISVCRSFELVQQLRETKAQLYALRDKRLKRFSTNQLNLRLGKLAVDSPERLAILTEIQFRSNLP